MSFHKGATVMSNAPKQPYIYEGVDPSPLDRSAGETLTETVKQAVHQAGDIFRRTRDAFESAKKPGMPLSILSNVAREAPLGTLFAAFLVGVIVGRRG